MKKGVLCSITTRGRYHSTLAMSIMSVATQTELPDHLVIFDDNDPTEDIREIPTLRHVLCILEEKKLSWEVIFGRKQGPHHNHQIANRMGFEWVWRLDDDAVAEPNALKIFKSHLNANTGAVGGSILTPPFLKNTNATGSIDKVEEQSIQWDYIAEKKAVDHLHCSFVYRAGIHDYNLGLSPVGFREETLFTWGLKQKGFDIFIVPGVITWHLKNPVGGIRQQDELMYSKDDAIFRNHLHYRDHTMVVLDCGMGDHVVFQKVLPLLKNPVVFSCYPEIVAGRSIGEAVHLFGDISYLNVYQKMEQWNWTESLEKAYRKLYGVDN
jgi:hypothetical protein